MNERSIYGLNIKVAPLVSGVLLMASHVQAQDWQFHPTVEIGVMSDDNNRLQSTPPKASVTGPFVGADLEMIATTPVSEFRIVPRVWANYFSNDRNEDSVNRYLDLLWNRNGQRVNSQFSAHYANEDSVRSNRPDNSTENGDLGNPDGGDSGFLAVHDRLENFGAGQQFQFQLTQRRSLELGADYGDYRYDQQVTGSNVSFRDITARLGIVQRVTERSRATLRATYLHYDPDLAGAAADTTGLQAQWDYQFTGRVQAYARLGANQTKFKELPPGADDSEYSMAGGLGGSWVFQVSRAFVDLTRDIDPNSSGHSVTRDQLRLRLERDFSERLTATIAGRVINDAAQGSPVTASDRRYAVATLGMEWRFRRAWSIQGQYSRTYQKYKLDTNTANSNSVHLSVLYEPRRGAGERRNVAQ